MKIGLDAKRLFHNSTGLGNYSRDLVRIMAKFNPENQYFLYHSKIKKIDRIDIDSKIVFEKLFAGSKLLRNFWRLSGIKKDLKIDKIDIFHGLSGEIPRGLKKTNIKTIVTIHDLIFVHYPELYKIIDRKIYFWKFKHAAEQADLVIAISEQTKTDIVNFLKISPDKIKVIYQGCAEIFKEEIAAEVLDDVRAKYNLPEKFILNVGTIEQRKNILSVIKAIEGKNIPLVIIGKKTNYFDEIEAFIKEKDMNSQVVFIKKIPFEDLASIYQLATIFVYPSIFEGFGIPIIEALYSKTPVITSTGSCFSEAGGPNSIYVEPNNFLELRKSIENLWNNDFLQKEMIEKGYQFVQKFNDENIALDWINTYKSL